MQQKLKPKDLAERWRCSPGHIIKLICSGKLRAMNIGTGMRARYLIDRSEVERFEKCQDHSKPVLRRPKKINVPNHVGM